MRIRSIQIEVTSACNLRCSICWGRDMARPSGFMKLALFKKVVDEAAGMPRLRTLSLHFNGESTIHPDFVEMLEYVGTKGFGRVEYTSNGMNVSDEVLLATVKLPVAHVHFSAHGLHPEPPETARRLRALRAEHGQGPRTSANICWGGQPPEKMNEHFAQWYGVVDKFSLSGTIDEMAWTHLPNGFVERSQPHCSQPFRYAAVLWDGSVTVCCHDLRGDLASGNVNTDTLVNTVHEPYFVELREQIRTQTTPEDCLCTKCDLWKVRYQFPVLKKPLPLDEPPGINRCGRTIIQTQRRLRLPVIS